MDIEQLIPSPSPQAIFEIFRSCLNELVRSGVVDSAATQVSVESAAGKVSSSPSSSKRRAVSRCSSASTPSPVKLDSSPDWTLLDMPTTIPTWLEVRICQHNQPDSLGNRVCALAEKCKGFSGRTLRRLSILGLARYTWGGSCSMHDAVVALGAAVEDELVAKQLKKQGQPAKRKPSTDQEP